MLRSFCDKCGTECQPNHSGSRRFESLAVASEGVSMGLEILPLFGKQQSPTAHVCDECIPELLTLAIDTYQDSAITREKYHWAHKLKSFEAVEREVHKRVAAIEEREAIAQDNLRHAAERVAIAEKQHQADLARIQVLTAQLNALQQAEATRVRMATAAAAQHDADEQSYPEYLERVNLREKKRVSG